MKKNKVTKFLVSGLICITIIFNLNSVFASNSTWSGQSISNFLTNKIDAPNVLKDEKYSELITRGEFAELIVALYAKSGNIDKNSIEIKENPFKDTKNLDVQRAYSLGIIEGINNHTFKPNEYVTREQIATMITRFLNIKAVNTNSTNNLDDFSDNNKISEWAFNSLSYCVENEIIKGYDTTYPKKQLLLDPKGVAFVEEVITMLDRMAIKNNWLIKSNEIYICGFKVPSDTKLKLEPSSGEYPMSILLDWDEIDDREKARDDLNYIFKQNSNYKEIIDFCMTSENVGNKEFTTPEFDILVFPDNSCTLIDIRKK